MGDLIDFLAYKRKKALSQKEYEDFLSEVRRLNVFTVMWTPYDVAKEVQTNPNWMDLFFYEDEDW
jgi:hypothetical protein